MATDIKERFPAKSVTLVHSRLHVLNRFHSKLHDIAAKRFEQLGIKLILGDRAVIPHEGFPLHDKEFEIELKSGKKIPSDFAVRVTICMLSFQWTDLPQRSSQLARHHSLPSSPHFHPNQ